METAKGIIKGLLLFQFVLVPGLILIAYLLAGGAWVIWVAVLSVAFWGLEHVGVPAEDTGVVLGTAVVLLLAYIGVVAARMQISRW